MGLHRVCFGNATELKAGRFGDGASGVLASGVLASVLRGSAASRHDGRLGRRFGRGATGGNSRPGSGGWGQGGRSGGGGGVGRLPQPRGWYSPGGRSLGLCLLPTAFPGAPRGNARGTPLPLAVVPSCFFVTFDERCSPTRRTDHDDNDGGGGGERGGGCCGDQLFFLDDAPTAAEPLLLILQAVDHRHAQQRRGGGGKKLTEG